MCICSDDHSPAHQRSAAINKAVDCGSEMLPHLPFVMDLAPSGSNLLPNMGKTLESYVFADNEEMIVSVMGVQDMFEIFFFKECLRTWVKSCDKFGNMNDFESTYYFAETVNVRCRLIYNTTRGR